MDKLLNKIKLVIAPYLREDMVNTDFQKGKISLARQIADIIDVVNDDNLQISRIDIGDVVVNKTMIGIGSRGLGRKDGGYLQFLDDDVEMFCKRIPFIPDGESNSYKIIVQKIAQTESPKEKEKELKNAKNKPKLIDQIQDRVVRIDPRELNDYLFYDPRQYRQAADGGEAPIDPGLVDMFNA